MKTKSFFTALLVCLLACTTVCAATKQERNVSAFDKIDVGSAFKVHLSQGTTQSVVVEVDDEYINNVKTTVKNGTLYIKLKGIKMSLKNRNIAVMNVYITIPTINSITASGAAKLLVETPIKSSGKVSLDLSGAAQLSNVALTCKELAAELSGASKCGINLTADIVTVDISGAGSLVLSGKVDKVAVDASGAAKVDINNLAYNTSDIDSSAAARVRAKR